MTAIEREKKAELDSHHIHLDDAVISRKRHENAATDATTEFEQVKHRHQEYEKATVREVLAYAANAILRIVLIAVDYFGYYQVAGFAAAFLHTTFESRFVAAGLCVIGVMLAEVDREMLAKVRHNPLAARVRACLRAAGIAVALFPVLILGMLAMAARGLGRSSDLQGILLWVVSSQYFVLATGMFIATLLLIFGGPESDHALSYWWYRLHTRPKANKRLNRAVTAAQRAATLARHLKQIIVARTGEFEHEYGWVPRHPPVSADTEEYLRNIFADKQYDQIASETEPEPQQE
ncbi:MAG: hypothetical protein M3Q69_05705 [Acidobacteriota bacterium]|nr:hypothetical protein [Acidobacteriota bacterium]